MRLIRSCSSAKVDSLSSKLVSGTARTRLQKNLAMLEREWI